MTPWRQFVLRCTAIFCGTTFVLPAAAVTNVYLTEVPDYDWWAGCFGTASGNLIGYWDRHGFPNFYTGPTGGGLAPLTTLGANYNIRALWASQAGIDGRPLSKPGHYDDYYVDYESTARDPYLAAGRPEHQADCIGDFLGLNQRKWADLNGECAGNIDGFSFVFWDGSGERRLNFTPQENGVIVPDIQSGLRNWTAYRRNRADVFTQLTDFNPTVPPGKGFTFEDLKAEIDRGYPVLLYLQNPDELSRAVGALPNANPHIHGMLAYGYRIDDSGGQWVRYQTSWASGPKMFSPWSAADWQAELPVRGVIGYHPLPQITSITRQENLLKVTWDGPSSMVTNATDGTAFNPHGYILEQATVLDPEKFQAVSSVTTDREVTVANCCAGMAFYRVRLVPLTPAE